MRANNLHFEVILELHPLIDSLIGPMFPTSKNIKNSGSMPWILFQPRFSSCYEYLGHSDKLLNITVLQTEVIMLGSRPAPPEIRGKKKRRAERRGNLANFIHA